MDSSFIKELTLVLASVGAGFILGYITSEIIDGRQDKSGKEIVLIVVMVVWAVSVLVDVITPIYSTSPFIHGMMGAIVGYLFNPLSKKKDKKERRRRK